MEIRGLTHFGEFFSDFKDDFIIIGGVATVIQLDHLGFDARVTKDIDMVVVSHPHSDFTDKLTTYIKEGGYKIELNREDQYSLYRFSEPKNELFPYQLELFSENFDLISLLPNQHIIPIDKSEIIHNLSAILLDKSYYEMLVQNSDIINDISVANPTAIMLLKAKAYREIKERKGSEKERKKHLNDIMRLTVTLTGKYKNSLDGQMKNDMASVIETIRLLDNQQTKNIMKAYAPMSSHEIAEVLEDYFIQ